MEALLPKSQWARNLSLILLGQVVSLLVTATGFTSSLLARQGINAPTAQSWFNYLLLAIICGSIVLYRQNKLHVPWYSFVLLAIVDVEANYLVVKAYQYTSITSVMLLDCWTIPCVLFLTWMFLKTRYAVGHYAGIALCILGLALVVLSDVHAADRSGGGHVILGDMLVIAAATLYALSNVGEEFLVKNVDPIQLLALLGCFGSIIGGIQFFSLEWHEVQHIQWTAKAISPFIGFSLAQFSFYMLVPYLLQASGSAMFNLSLLTSDMWAVAIRALVFHQRVDWLYFLAFGTVGIGLIIYNLCGAPIQSKPNYREEPNGNELAKVSDIHLQGELPHQKASQLAYQMAMEDVENRTSTMNRTD